MNHLWERETNQIGKALFLLVISVMIAAFVAGGFLRAWELGDQIVQGDEIWTLEPSVDHDLRYLITQHHEQSFSVPLALWNKLLLSTTGLSEWGMRLPVFLSSLILLAAIGLFIWRQVGPTEGMLVIWIAAVSPILILYSRFARPYGGVALLSLLATASWLAWLEKRHGYLGFLSAITGAGAVYLHLFALPAIACLWAYGIFEDLLKGLLNSERASAESKRHWVHSLLWAVAGGVIGFLLFLPSLPSLIAFIQAKQGTHNPQPDSWWGALHFLFGTHSNGTLIFMTVTAVLGLGWCWRINRRLAVVSLIMMAAQSLAVLLSGPQWSGWSYVLARYLIPALPALLTFTACGLALYLGVVRWAVGRWLGKRLSRAAVVPALVIFLIIIVRGGSLPSIYSSPNSFANHPDYYTPPGFRLSEDRIPTFYKYLAASEKPFTVAEAPLNKSFFVTIYGFYQNMHRKVVRSVSARPVFRAPGTNFRTILPVTGDSITLRDADLIIVHKKGLAEINHVSPFEHNVSLEKKLRDWEKRKGHHESEIQADAAKILRACRKHPELSQIWEDLWIVVFARGSAPRTDFEQWRRRSNGKDSEKKTNYHLQP